MKYTPILIAVLLICTSCATVSTGDLTGTDTVLQENPAARTSEGKPPVLNAVVRKAEVQGPKLWYRPVEISVRRAGADNVDATEVKLRAADAEPAAVPLVAPSRVFHPADGSDILLEVPPTLAREIEELSANIILEWERHVNSERAGKRTGRAPDWADYWDYEYIVYVEWFLVLEMEFPATGRPELTLTVPLGPPMRNRTEGGSVRKKPGLTEPPKSLAAFGLADATGRAPLARGFQLDGLDDFYDR
ncbi:MAG: hypothetical protein KF754_03960 [Planctomycetes bacterium]|nr:hypothetical protein [Planctomycetota bacterium]